MRALRRFAVVVALVSASVGVDANPASAGTFDFCSGSGTLTAFSPFSYPLLGGTAVAAYSFTFNIGGCVLGHSNTAGGTLNGWCGLATGTVVWDEHTGSAVWSGGTIEFHGQVEGSFSVANNVFSGHSCTVGATDFVFSGSVFLQTV